MDSTIIDKVQKLLSLSKSSNLNEAAAATRAAEILISKYRLSEADLSSQQKSAADPVKDNNILYQTGKVIRWKSSLAMSLAKHYGCAIYNDGTYSESATGRLQSRYRLVGQPSDLELTRFMFGWLTSEIERLSRRNCQGQGKIASQSYCEGAVAGVNLQLKEAKQQVTSEAKQQATSETQSSVLSTALAILDNREAESLSKLHQLIPNLRTQKSYSHRQIDSDAYQAGKTAGRNIHLGKGLGSKDQSKLLK